MVKSAEQQPKAGEYGGGGNRDTGPNDPLDEAEFEGREVRANVGAVGGEIGDRSVVAMLDGLSDGGGYGVHLLGREVRVRHAASDGKGIEHGLVAASADCRWTPDQTATAAVESHALDLVD